MFKLENFINKKNIKKYDAVCTKINNKYEEFKKQKSLKDKDDFSAKLQEIKTNKSLSDKDKIVDAIALAKLACEKVMNMSYYDVQLVGGLVLVDGAIAEMKTGEGKTLTCSIAVVANYALGYLTHVATANEYLAKRDQEHLEKLYDYLGIKSSHVIATMNKSQKQEAYLADVVYSTAQELGFDYLRDALIQNWSEKIQPRNFKNIKAIIDEADFILIDEARTPLIISGNAPMKEEDVYALMRNWSLMLKKMSRSPNENKFENDEYIPGDFWVDDKNKSAYLSEEGYEKLEQLAKENGILNIPNGYNEKLNALYHQSNSWILHEILNALKAQYLYIKDKDYVVHEGEVVIIDQNTGRLSEGRNWSFGLHQAIEQKENVKINPETKTLGSISIQNYFRIYAKISGMSGTVMQSAEEFEEIYNTTTVRIPTNKPMIRKDLNDKIYKSLRAKYQALIIEVKQRHEKGQPILIGTTSVAESEKISELLNKANIKHNVLNAKNNLKEAHIIAQAGQPYAVTVSTSMAGRGTDIILGGNVSSYLENITQLLEKIENRKVVLEQVKIEIEKQYPDVKQENPLQMNLTKKVENKGKKNKKINDNYLEKIHQIDYSSIEIQVNAFYENSYLVNFIPNKINDALNILNHLNVELLKIEDTIKEYSEQWKDYVKSIGGLCVLGSSRNESRRIDDQLRGRAGRQGDPGVSLFFLSMEDSWVRVFGKTAIFSKLAGGWDETMPIESPMVSKIFENAQKSIEGHAFTSRKSTFQYDTIADEGRNQFLQIRNNFLDSDFYIKNLSKDLLLKEFHILAHSDFIEFMENILKLKIEDESQLMTIILKFKPKELMKYVQEFKDYQKEHFVFDDNLLNDNLNQQYVGMINLYVENFIQEKEKYEDFWPILNYNSLKILDNHWSNHLVFIDDAQRDVGYSSLVQKNPLHEFKKLCFESFSTFVNDFKKDIILELIKLTEEKEKEENEFNASQEIQYSEIKKIDGSIQKKELQFSRDSENVLLIDKIL